MNSRNKKKKPVSKTKKMFMKMFKYIAVIFVLIGVIIFFLLSPLFNITHVEVKGNKKITSELITNLSGIALNENTFKINKNQAIKNIKSEPYIESVKIIRNLPDTIEIQVVERQATYMLEFANGFVFINNQGYILETSQEKAELPIIVGYKTSTEEITSGKRLNTGDLQRLEIVLKIMETAKNNDIATYITKIDISNIMNFKLMLETEGKVAYIGDCSSINTRIQYLKTIIEKEQGKRGEAFIDGDMNKSSATFREEV